ncbi:MAG: hypothetical protein K5787_11395, partial [Lentisphaeria bacterium]|nr:hypothetical protein [Lentisphaeria bacterium]
RAARPVDSISFFKELTPGGEPHGVSSFHSPISLSFAHIALPGFQRACRRANARRIVTSFTLHRFRGFASRSEDFFIPLFRQVA